MPKKVWFSMTTHPNMNYDRSLRSVIWREFPKLYRLYLNYVRNNPRIKTHMQLPPQTLLSLKQCAPDVIELAQELRAKGRLRFMGTFFSESIAQCQDGMSMLDAAELGCRIASGELGADLEGFFLQEIAYTPQLPYVIQKLGVQWVTVRDWEDALKPYFVEGLDGSRCVAVPLIEHPLRQRIRENPDIIPDNALLITHCDMEIPVAIKRMHELEVYLREKCGFETEWCFVGDYIQNVGVHAVKRLTPCTNKREDPPESPSFSRWCSDHLSMQVHDAALSAMEARRAACLAAFAQSSQRKADFHVDLPPARPWTTWEVENPWLYPELVELFGASHGRDASVFDQMAMLIAWGSNSDGRGWYPLLERRFERIDSFHEAQVIAHEIIRQSIPCENEPDAARLTIINPHGIRAEVWHAFRFPRKVAVLDAEGRDAVACIRRDGNTWEHHLRFDAAPYTAAGFQIVRSSQSPARERPGSQIANERFRLRFEDGLLHVEGSDASALTVGMEPFQVFVKCLDTGLRPPQPEGDWRVSVISGVYPRLIACRQIDYHIHFRAEYTLDADRIFADWRFWFTYPTLVDSLDDFDAGGPKTDFTPGGICAMVTGPAPGEVWYDVPFGVVRHPNPDESFVAPLTHVFLAHPEGGGVLLASCSGSQSFKVHGGAGRIGVCMGKSITSGGRRKLLHWSGNRIDEFGCDTDWYKEFFYGELRHRFVIHPFRSDWRTVGLPNVGRMLARGVQILEGNSGPKTPLSLARLEPFNVRLAGIAPDAGRVVLCEMCGVATDFSLEIAGKQASGRIGPWQILEWTLS